MRQTCHEGIRHLMRRERQWRFSLLLRALLSSRRSRRGERRSPHHERPYSASVVLPDVVAWVRRRGVVLWCEEEAVRPRVPLRRTYSGRTSRACEHEGEVSPSLQHRREHASATCSEDGRPCRLHADGCASRRRVAYRRARTADSVCHRCGGLHGAARAEHLRTTRERPQEHRLALVAALTKFDIVPISSLTLLDRNRRRSEAASSCSEECSAAGLLALVGGAVVALHIGVLGSSAGAARCVPGRGARVRCAAGLLPCKSGIETDY